MLPYKYTKMFRGPRFRALYDKWNSNIHFYIMKFVLVSINKNAFGNYEMQIVIIIVIVRKWRRSVKITENPSSNYIVFQYSQEDRLIFEVFLFIFLLNENILVFYEMDWKRWEYYLESYTKKTAVETSSYWDILHISATLVESLLNCGLNLYVERDPFHCECWLCVNNGKLS